MAELGYDAVWHGVRAADVGACHGRFRIFVVAYPTGKPWRLEQRDGGAAADPGSEHRGERVAAPDETEGRRALSQPAGCGRTLPTPTTRDHKRGYRPGRAAPGRRGSAPLNDVIEALPAKLLPTPAVNDMGDGKSLEWWDEWTAKMKAEHGNGNGHGASLAIEAQRMLPTPSAADGNGGGRYGSEGHAMPLPGAVVQLLPTPRAEEREQVNSSDAGVALSKAVQLLPTVVTTDAKDARNRTANRRPGSTAAVGDTLGDVAYVASWGDYEPAIRRWEDVTRPAPTPTEVGPKGGARLSARFAEWMMGLSDGWVTGVPGITRNEALKACGNGVVPQQAFAAVLWCLRVAARLAAA